MKIMSNQDILDEQSATCLLVNPQLPQKLGVCTQSCLKIRLTALWFTLFWLCVCECVCVPGSVTDYTPACH